MGKSKKQKNKHKRPKAMRRPILAARKAFGWMENCVPVDRNAFRVAGRRASSERSIHGKVCVWCGSVFPNVEARKQHVASTHTFVADRFGENRTKDG